MRKAIVHTRMLNNRNSYYSMVYRMTSQRDAEYSPSVWSKRFSSGDQVILHHYDVIRIASESARNLVPYKSVSYGQSSTDTLDLYGTDLNEDAPVCVFIHGGYWQAGSKTNHAFMVVPLHQAGYKIAVLDYELCPQSTVCQIVDQIIRSILFLNDYADKAKHFTFVGHSAGAHLILCAIERLRTMLTRGGIANTPLRQNRIKHVFLISGIYDLSELRHTSINQNNILGLDDVNTHTLSPLRTIDFRNWSTIKMNIHIYAGEYDSSTFKDQSRILHNHVNGVQCGVQTTFQIIETLDHFDIVEKLSDPSYELTRKILETVD